MKQTEPTLYVAATPIGNLSEASPRLKELLASCDLVLCEDTRVTHKLFAAFDIPVKRLVSCHQYNERQKAGALVAQIAEQGLSACLVTDAGTPCISDPGFAVVNAAWERGLAVRAVSGPCAAAAALSISGFEAPSYAFFGFLPRERKARAEVLARIRGCGLALAVLYESPFRVKALLAELAQALPGVRLSLSCDLTKLFERTLRGEPLELLALLEQNPNAERGEYALVLDLSGVVPLPPPPKPSAGALLLDLALSGVPLREAASRVGAMEGYSRNEAYRASLEVARLFPDPQDEGPERGA